MNPSGTIGPEASSVRSCVSSREPPIQLTFEHAPDRVWSMASAVLASSTVAVVGITGPVGSGKSTLARQLLAHAGVSALPRGAVVLSTDEYLPDYSTVDPLERDLPEHADLTLLAEHLAALRSGRPADVPVWSFHTHRREGVREVAPASLIICEGIHALHAKHRAHLDVRVFVDAPRDVRWARWEAIERQGLRGMGVEAARVHFDTIADPSFFRASDEYRRAAHLVVHNTGQG